MHYGKRWKYEAVIQLDYSDEIRRKMNLRFQLFKEAVKSKDQEL